MTSYDTIYRYFINNITIDSMFLPQTVEEQKDAIANAVAIYKNRMREELECDDDNETVSIDLSNEQLLILANMIKLVVVKNIHSYKSSLLYTFTKEIGVKDVQAQLKAAQYDIALQEKVINDLIFYSDDESIM